MQRGFLLWSLLGALMLPREERRTPFLGDAGQALLPMTLRSSLLESNVSKNGCLSFSAFCVNMLASLSVTAKLRLSH